MKWKILLVVFVLLVVSGVVWYVARVDTIVLRDAEVATPLLPLPDSPLNASYNMGGLEVRLVDGRADVEVVPGSASRMVTQVWGTPVTGDINGDGQEDAVLLLTSESGGSGTFYYVAVAVRDGDGYIGSNAVLLGDRVAPQDVLLWHGVIVVNVVEHDTDQSFAEAPSKAVSHYYTVAGANLIEFSQFDTGEAVLAGRLSLKEGVHTFTTCAGDVYLVSPESRADAVLTAVYAERTRNDTADGSVFMVVAASIDASSVPANESASADAAMEISTVLSAPESGACDDPIVTSGRANSASATSTAETDTPVSDTISP